MSSMRPIGLILVLALSITWAVSSADPLYPYSAEEYQAHEEAFLAPLNPAYLNYIAGNNQVEFALSGEESRTLGLVPATVDLSGNKGKQVGVSSSGTLPGIVSASSPSYAVAGKSGSTSSKFDLRALGKVTPVRDQEQCGCCWAFSTYGSLESTLLPGESWDFSENNMKGGSGYDLGACGGGNNVISAAYLTRWSGAVSEADDPYYPSSYSSSRSGTVRKHVQEVLYIPARDGSSDNANIKSALMTEGAVYSTIHWEDYYFRPSTASYYYPGSRDANHAIVIIGWDDTYDRRYFSPSAPGDGAFLVKNSWGTDWGDDGYFYVSYYDTVIGLDNAVFIAEPADNYDHNYQYDTLGWTESAGLGGQRAYFANIFTAQGQEQVTAVSFYTPVVDSSYEVSVYTDPSNGPVTSVGPKATTSGTVAIPGYHTIRLDNPVPVSAGQRFSVVVELTTPGTRFPVAIESPIRGYSGKATAQSGQSYVSSDGSEWTDLTRLYTNSNVCLKAFTDDGGQAVKVTPTPTPTATPTATRTATPVPTATRTAVPTATPVPAVTVMPIVYPSYPSYTVPAYNDPIIAPVTNYSAYLFVYGAPSTPFSYIDEIGTLLPVTSGFVSSLVSAYQGSPVVPAADLTGIPGEPGTLPVNLTLLEPGPVNEMVLSEYPGQARPGYQDPDLVEANRTVLETSSKKPDSGKKSQITASFPGITDSESGPSWQETGSGDEPGQTGDISTRGPGTIVNETAGTTSEAVVFTPENSYLFVSDPAGKIPFPFMLFIPGISG